MSHVNSAGVGANSVLDPFAQSILANVESQQQQDAFADFKEPWDFPAVSLAEVLSGPQSNHGVGNLSGSENTFLLPEISSSMSMALPGFSTGTNGEPTQDDTDALLDVLRAHS